MTKVMRSKFLWVTPSKDNETFMVIHERSNIAVEAASEVIDLIDKCITLRTPTTGDPDEQELYRLLAKLHFLHNEAYGESEAHDILHSWLERFGKKARRRQHQKVTAIFAAGENEPVHQILTEVLTIAQDLHQELLPFRQPINILFLTPEEYQYLQMEFRIPGDISAFVDSRTLLIMDYQSYFRQDNTSSFYPTIRHELIHILFGQHAYYLPFWVEEGLCEYYSNKYRMDYLNRGLRQADLISFVEIHGEKVSYISQLSRFGDIQHVFYQQAVSFIHFMFRTLTAGRIWKMIRKSSITRNFFEELEKECGITLAELQTNWEWFVKREI